MMTDITTEEEQARALLQVAGLGGVEVGARRTVTMPLAEAEALRAAAAQAPAATAPAIGAALPEGVAPTGIPAPAGHGAPLTAADVRNMTADEINARWDDVQAALKGGG